MSERQAELSAAGTWAPWPRSTRAARTRWAAASSRRPGRRCGRCGTSGWPRPRRAARAGAGGGPRSPRPAVRRAGPTRRAAGPGRWSSRRHQVARTSSGASVSCTISARGTTSTCPSVIGAMVPNATATSSAHTNRPGISPAMILVNRVLMAPTLVSALAGELLQREHGVPVAGGAARPDGLRQPAMVSFERPMPSGKYAYISWPRRRRSRCRTASGRSDGRGYPSQSTGPGARGRRGLVGERQPVDDRVPLRERPGEHGDVEAEHVGKRGRQPGPRRRRPAGTSTRFPLFT